MMTHHYPQRVAAAYVRNTPLMLNAFLTVVWPFIDPATKDKVDMKGQVGGRIDSAVLIGDWGGELDVRCLQSVSLSLKSAADVLRAFVFAVHLRPRYLSAVPSPARRC